MHPVLAFFNALFMLVVHGLRSFALLYFFRLQFDRPGPLPASTVVIPKGEGVSGIAEQLERRGHHRPRHVRDEHHLLYVFARRRG